MRVDLTKLERDILLQFIKDPQQCRSYRSIKAELGLKGLGQLSLIDNVRCRVIKKLS